MSSSLNPYIFDVGQFLCWVCSKLKFVGCVFEVVNKSSVRCRVVRVHVFDVE